MRRLLFVTAVLGTLVIPPNERLAVALSPWLAPPAPPADIVATFKDQRGQDCETIRQPVTIAGQSADATGTLCRRIDRRWHFIP